MALNTAGLVRPFFFFFFFFPNIFFFLLFVDQQKIIGIKTGMTIDDFAPRLSFFFAIGMNFYMVCFNFRSFFQEKRRQLLSFCC